MIYLSARHNQIQALQSQQESLNSAHQHLEKEQEEVKIQLDAVQRTLARLRVTGQAALSKVNLLHLSLSKLGLAQVCVCVVLCPGSLDSPLY